MTVPRMLLLAIVVSACGFDLALEGWNQQQCRHEIQNLVEEVNLSQQRLCVRQIGFQSEVRLGMSPLQAPARSNEFARRPLEFPSENNSFHSVPTPSRVKELGVGHGL